MDISIATTGAAFAAGLSGSIGPCAAPRYMALAGSMSGAPRTRRWMMLASFVAGSAMMYAAVALLSGAFTAVLSASHLLYPGLALAFCIIGLATSVVHRSCRRRDVEAARFGAPFLAGASSGLMFSPCCTPAALATGSLVASGAASATAALALCCSFLLGHIAPVVLAGHYAGKLAELLGRCGFGDAVTTVGSACTIALGLYYGCAA